MLVDKPEERLYVAGGLLVHGGNERFSLKDFDVLPWFLG